MSKIGPMAIKGKTQKETAPAHFGRGLSRVLSSRGLTAAEVAKLSRVPRTTVRRSLGGSGIGLGNAVGIASALDVTVDELLSLGAAD